MPPASSDGEDEEEEGQEDAEDGDDEPGPGDLEVDFHGRGCAGLGGRGCAGRAEAAMSDGRGGVWVSG